jgi:transposase
MMLVSRSDFGTPEPEEPRQRRHRRIWTTAEKRHLVAETLEPGASVSQVARRHDINANLLFTWRRQARSGVLDDALPSAAGPEGLRLIPIEVAAAGEALPVRQLSCAPMQRAQPARPADDQAGSIEIVLPSGVRVRVDALVDEPALRRVLAAIGSPS